MDPECRIRIWDILKNLNECTVVMTTHNLEEVEFLASKIYILDKGSVQISGTVDFIK